jgi:hypothetical protein
MDLVVFDLDGTLALNEHRQHFLNKPKKNWTSFFDDCDKDEPNWPIIKTLWSLYYNEFDIEIWTGRTNRVHDKTVAWLDEYDLSRFLVNERDEKDHTPDTELKQRWLNESNKKPIMTFDDRDSVVQMWRSNGIVCCQVAEGNF